MSETPAHSTKEIPEVIDQTTKGADQAPFPGLLAETIDVWRSESRDEARAEEVATDIGASACKHEVEHA